MSFWPPSSAPWSLGPGVRRENEGVGKREAQGPRWRRCHRTDLSALGTSPARCSGSFKKKAPSVPQSPWRLDVLLVAVQCSVVPGSRPSPGKRGVGKRGSRGRGGPAATERTSAHWALRRHDARVLLKRKHPSCRRALAARCPFGCRPMLRGPWIPAFAGKTRGRKAGAQKPRWCRCHRTDPVQRALRRHGVRVHAPFVSPAKAGAQEPRWSSSHRADLNAVELPPARCPSGFKKMALSVPQSPLAARCPFGCRPVLRGPWVPAFAGKTRGRKAGVQGPRWSSCHRTDLSAVGTPPARCLSSLEKQHPPCRRALGGPMSFWLPSSAPWSLGPGFRRENEG